MKGLTFNNKTLYLSAVPTHYKSFMLVVNGNAIPGVDYSIMEIGDLAINDISGFNYVTANPTANFQGINPPSHCVDGNTATKWMTTQNWTYNTQSGMVIFTVNDPIVPSSYKLFNANDAADRDGSKLPGPRALFGSTGTPTTSSDASWELLSYTDYKLPVENLVWTSAMPTSNNHQDVNAVLGYEDRIPYTVLYENDNTYTGTGLKFATGALSTDNNFIVITFKLSTNATNADSYVYLRTSTDTSKNIWVGNARGFGAYAYASYFRSSAGGWNALMNPSVGTDGSNTGNVYYASSLNASDANDYKIIFDKSAAKAYCYINKLNILNADYITFDPLNFEAGTDGSDATFGSIKVLSCETLADALSI